MVPRKWSGLGHWLMAATLLSMACEVQAQVTNTIYQDNFSRTGMLNGSTPSLANASHAAWTGFPELFTDGFEISVTNATPTNGNYNNAFLPFTPQAGHIYTLSVGIKETRGNNHWLAFGFAQNALLNNYYAADNIGMGWLLQRADDSEVQLFLGPGMRGDATLSSSGSTNVFNRYSIVLDTTAANASSGWTITFYRNEIQVAQDVYSLNPAIRYVGIGADGATGYYRDFSLSDYIPTNFAAGGYRNVAFWSEPGVQVEVSSHSFRNGAMKAEGNACPLNRPFIPGQPDSRCWISSEYEHLPQWVWIHFPNPRRIDKVVLYAVNMATSPI